MDREITYKIIRSRRKTVSVIVERDGSLIVRAPLRYPEKSVEEFVFKKREWILRTVERVKKSNAENMFSLENGAKIELLGKEYTIRLTEEKRAFLTENEIVLPANLEKQAFEKLTYKLLRAYIVPRTEEIAAKNGLRFNGISVTSARTRWGSCGAGDTLNFSRALVFMPSSVVDYVICHELCHTLEKNHSARFYARVKSICPDYKTAEQVLKARAAVMNYLYSHIFSISENCSILYFPETEK